MRHLLVILAAVAAMTSCKKETVANEKDAAGTMLTCAVSDSKMSIGQAENDSYPCTVTVK